MPSLTKAHKSHSAPSLGFQTGIIITAVITSSSGEERRKRWQSFLQLYYLW
jgi:hypothetical protein